MPQEVIKQRLVTGIYPNFAAAVQTIYATEGIRGFYAAWLPTVRRAVWRRVTPCDDYHPTLTLARTPHHSTLTTQPSPSPSPLPSPSPSPSPSPLTLTLTMTLTQVSRNVP